jgi:hypothetical protein
MDFLFDHHSLVYLLLACSLVIVGAIWWRTRKRNLTIAAGVIALLIILFALVDVFLRPETDQEKLERTVHEMLDSFRKPVNTSKAEQYISDSVQSHQHLSKSDFVKEVAKLSERYGIRNAQLSEFRDWKIDRSAKSASVRFNVTLDSEHADRTYTAACEAQFVLEDDGEWRLKSYKVFFPPTSTEEYPSSELP